MDNSPTILAVDETPHNLKLLEAILTPRGYRMVTAADGQEALERVLARAPDLILLDVMMPRLDGYQVVERLRADPATRYLPIVMVTALDAPQEKVKAIEAGADDFLNKPFNQQELLVRVRSLLRIKQYHDTIEAQAAQLAEWNRALEARVQAQVQELERVGRLRRFLSPQVAELIVSQGQEHILESHRREITVVFCDLRGFTAFAETSEPEEVMSVLREYYAMTGELIARYEGTLEHLAGDGMMVFFNDPVPCADPVERAVRMALDMREQALSLRAGWQRRGYTLDMGIGIALGFATVGQIGSQWRADYKAIGSVTNLGARLCAAAKGGQILVSQRVFGSVEARVEAEPVGALALKGFSKPVAAYNILRWTDDSGRQTADDG